MAGEGGSRAEPGGRNRVGGGNFSVGKKKPRRQQQQCGSRCPFPVVVRSTVRRKKQEVVGRMGEKNNHTVNESACARARPPGDSFEPGPTRASCSRERQREHVQRVCRPPHC